jgi:hypothetical protein
MAKGGSDPRMRILSGKFIDSPKQVVEGL